MRFARIIYLSPRLARSLLFFVVDSVRLSRSFNLLLLFLFVNGIEPFLAVSSPCGTLQKFFLDFWFRPPNPQILLPKISTKLPITRLVWQIDRRCLHLTGGFRGRPIQWNHAKCCGPTLVAMASKFGLGAEIQLPTGL